MLPHRAKWPTRRVLKPATDHPARPFAYPTTAQDWSGENMSAVTAITLLSESQSPVGPVSQDLCSALISRCRGG